MAENECICLVVRYAPEHAPNNRVLRERWLCENCGREFSHQAVGILGKLIWELDRVGLSETVRGTVAIARRLVK
jgi:hypothetical protein